MGLFSYYSQWIKDFAAKVRPLAQNLVFPLAGEALESFNSLKLDVEKSVVQAVDETQPFQVETDASEFALSATLNQNGRPVAFFSRTLSGSELKHSSVEKEAAAIVEAVRKWRHYLTGKHFTLITDQKSVAYMFNTKRRSKIKNDKIMRWRLELSTYNFDIVYRAGEENVPADTFSRVRAMSLTLDNLSELHRSLCHPRSNSYGTLCKEPQPSIFNRGNQTYDAVVQDLQRMQTPVSSSQTIPTNKSDSTL